MSSFVVEDRTALAQSVEVTDETLSVELADGRTIAVPVFVNQTQSYAIEQMLTNCAFAPLLYRHVQDFAAPAGKNFIEIFRRAMKFLRPDNEVHVGRKICGPPTLRSMYLRDETIQCADTISAGQQLLSDMRTDETSAAGD